MASYLSISEKERNEMLSLLGIAGVADLFNDIPRELRRKKVVLSDGKSEQEVYAAFSELASRNASYTTTISRRR